MARRRGDEPAEAGREALHLRLDPLAHVGGGAVRHVAVGPQRVPARRRPAGVEQRLLGHEHVGPLGLPPRGHLGLRGGDLLQRAPEVHGARAAAVRRGPRHGPVEGQVELEHAGAVAVAGQLAAVARGEPVAGQGEHLARGHVEQHGPRRGQRVHALHPGAGPDLPAERAQVGRQGVGQAPATRPGPRASRCGGRAWRARGRTTR